MLGSSLLLGAIDHGNLAKVEFVWFLWLALALASVLSCVVYFSRRAIWLCLFRALFLATFMLTLGIALLMLAMEALTPGPSVALAASACAFLVVCAVLVHFKKTVPYWRLTFTQNTAGKIDLRTGVFSATTEWAPFPGNEVTKSQRDFIVYGVVPIGGALLVMLYHDLSGTPWVHVLVAMNALGLFGAAAYSDSEAYFAYKLLELERQIGKPIVMDGYQKEEHLAGGAAHE